MKRWFIPAALGGVLLLTPFASIAPAAPASPPPAPTTMQLAGPTGANEVAVYDVVAPAGTARLVLIWHGGLAVSCAQPLAATPTRSLPHQDQTQALTTTTTPTTAPTTTATLPLTTTPTTTPTTTTPTPAPKAWQLVTTLPGPTELGEVIAATVETARGTYLIVIGEGTAEVSCPGAGAESTAPLPE